MDNFDKIVKQIEEKSITPIPKWRFTFKNTSAWLIFVLSVLIGASAFSIILFSIQQTDFELLSHLNHSKIESLLVFLPFFWLIVLIIFSIFAFISFRNSKKSYKYSPLNTIVLSTFLSVLFGTLFFISGGAQKLERSFANKVSIYKSIDEKKLKIWMKPEDGLLSGSIIKTENDTIYLIDFENTKWKVLYEDVFVPPILTLEKDEKIKLIGKAFKNHVFITKQIRPWGSFGKQMNQKEIEERIKKISK